MATKELMVDPAKVLRDQERLLAIEYGASHPPASLGGEDLDCRDPRDARHWVRVYTELVEFIHGLMEGQPPEPIEEPGRVPPGARAMALQASVLELHLAFWTDRLRRLATGDDLGGGDSGGQQSS